ncbi:hypothetical protein GW17_00044156 [Ensete ventricosum]|nr:hypothetical protein GW17_00044156 [Ensete ventricosum]
MLGQNQVRASGQGSDKAVRARREFAKAIGKLTGNKLGDRLKKTIRLVERLPEVADCWGLGRLLNSKVLYSCNQ